jgi:hypothetical protein
VLIRVLSLVELQAEVAFLKMNHFMQLLGQIENDYHANISQFVK